MLIVKKLEKSPFSSLRRRLSEKIYIQAGETKSCFCERNYENLPNTKIWAYYHKKLNKYWGKKRKNALFFPHRPPVGGLWGSGDTEFYLKNCRREF